MYLIYYDEVKYSPPEQKYYWYGGIAIHEDNIQSEVKINKLSDDYFGSSALRADTEFHAKDIFHGKGNFKGRPPVGRMELLSNLLDIAAGDHVHGMYSKVNAEALPPAMDPQVTSFTFFVEKAEGFLRSRNSLGMLFGDYDKPLVGPSVATLSEFRRNGTYWKLGREIRSFVDTVHFAHSHHSRLIQLADVYLYSRQFLCGNNTSYARRELEQIIRSKSGLHPATYREYL